MLPIFPVGREFDPASVEGKLLSNEAHDKVQDAAVYTYEIDQGNILITVRSGVLHEVIYQTPRLFPWTKKKKNKYLFEQYCSEDGWKEILDNGFGKSYRSNDKEMYSLWSYAMDFNTFGTMQFHALES